MPFPLGQDKTAFGLDRPAFGDGNIAFGLGHLRSVKAKLHSVMTVLHSVKGNMRSDYAEFEDLGTEGVVRDGLPRPSVSINPPHQNGSNETHCLELWSRSTLLTVNGNEAALRRAWLPV
jgi:hypothetical protein